MTKQQQPTTNVLTAPLSFSEARRLIKEVDAVLDGLEGVRPPNPNGSAPGSGETARELLNAADALAYASALVRNEYWHWKGGVSL